MLAREHFLSSFCGRILTMMASSATMGEIFHEKYVQKE
jgi:hypothetical protein